MSLPLRPTNSAPGIAFRDALAAYQPHGWLARSIHGIPLGPFAITHFLDDTLLAAGVDLLLETRVIAAEVRGGRITHVVTQNKSGLAACVADRQRWPDDRVADVLARFAAGPEAGLLLQNGILGDAVPKHKGLPRG